ncbi:MAG: alkaline phosphatase family protein, partial [Inhella sp.]
MSPRSLFAGLCLAFALAVQAAPPPRLVVLLVVDGLPMRQVEAWRDQFGADGLRRFLDQGRTFAQAFYEHGHTVTGVGHASLLSGAPPQVHGVISNGWTDPQSLASVYCTQDEAHHYLALPPGQTPRGAGSSPKNLLAETVGDRLRAVDARAKVIGVSGKDRGAILPAGHRGTAYMYLSENGLFSSSSYYMAEHPAWVKAFNARRPADAFWGQTWTPLRPAAHYAADAPDASPWMRAAGYGNRLPATLGDGLDGRGPRYYTDL